MMISSIRTIRVRVKDKHAAILRAMAVETNQVWNYANELSDRMIRERGHWMTGFDFSPYTRGASTEFELIGSSTIQETCEQFAVKRRKARKTKLRWRKSFGSRRSLGWVPFKARATHYAHGQVFFAGHWFSIWDSYGLAGTIFRAGAFSEDVRGRWYFCAAILVETAPSLGLDRVGIDLGCRDAATTSDGNVLPGRWYRQEEVRLAIAQRAGKKQRARAIGVKIAHRRRDAQHKFSTALVARCGEIHVGDVSLAKLVKTNMAKSALDAGWASLKTMLAYKSRQAGIVYTEVNEAYTTVTCSACETRSGPRGLKGLRVRHWECGVCGARHNRDVNAARNILRVAAGHGRPVEGIPCL